MLYQHARETTSGDKDGAGLICHWQGSWDLVGRETGHQGGLRWRIENRSSLASQSPSELGSAAGATALNPGFGYSANFDWDFSVFNWPQGFADNRVGVAAGRLDFAAYLDAFAFQTFSRGFLNRSFLVHPTLGTTGVGAFSLGAGWATPNRRTYGSEVQDEYVVEASYKVQLTRNFSLLPNLQLLLDPATNPDEDRLNVFGLRAGVAL